VPGYLILQKYVSAQRHSRDGSSHEQVMKEPEVNGNAGMRKEISCEGWKDRVKQDARAQ
jgi:hypothetical protein